MSFRVLARPVSEMLAELQRLNPKFDNYAMAQRIIDDVEKARRWQPIETIRQQPAPGTTGAPVLVTYKKALGPLNDASMIFHR